MNKNAESAIMFIRRLLLNKEHKNVSLCFWIVEALYVLGFIKAIHTEFFL